MTELEYNRLKVEHRLNINIHGAMYLASFYGMTVGAKIAWYEFKAAVKKELGVTK